MQPPATTCCRGVIVPFDTTPSSVRRKEERCTGNLTSLFLTLYLAIPRFLFLPSLPRVDQGRESSVCPTSSAAMSASYVLSRYFAFPSPGSSQCMSRFVSLLSWHAPTPSEFTHTYTHTHSHTADLTVPSRPILAAAAAMPPCVVSARGGKRSSESRGLFRGGFPFSHLWVPPYPRRSSYPLPPWGIPLHGGVGCDPGPLRRLSSLLPDPF